MKKGILLVARFGNEVTHQQPDFWFWKKFEGTPGQDGYYVKIGENTYYLTVISQSEIVFTRWECPPVVSYP